MKKVMKLAASEKRLGAFCIDKVVPVIVLIMTISVARGFARLFVNYFDSFGYGYDYGYNHTGGAGTFAAFLLSILLFLAYLVVQLFFYSKSQTIGKAILGLTVISSENGKPLGFWKMLLREWFAKKASGSVLLLGFIWILIDDKNRGWHDKIVDSYVVDNRLSAKLTAEHNAKEKAAAEHAFAQKPEPTPTPASAAVPTPNLAEITIPEESGDVMETSDVTEIVSAENSSDEAASIELSVSTVTSSELGENDIAE